MNTFFVFNKNYYKQQEGLGMGLPLVPTMVNILVCILRAQVYIF